jgi:transcriptional regulator with XRE-family HTH domain
MGPSDAPGTRGLRSGRIPLHSMPRRIRAVSLRYARVWTMPRMSPRERLADTAMQRIRRQMSALGMEARTARIALGWTQAKVGRRARVSQSSVSRLEAGGVRPAVAIVGRILAAIGLDLGMKAWPGAGVGLRDSGQLSLAENLDAAAHMSWRTLLEVPTQKGGGQAADFVWSVSARESTSSSNQRSRISRRSCGPVILSGIRSRTDTGCRSRSCLRSATRQKTARPCGPTPWSSEARCRQARAKSCGRSVRGSRSCVTGCSGFGLRRKPGDGRRDFTEASAAAGPAGGGQERRP